MKNIKKIGKKGILGIGIIIVIATLGVASVFSYFISISGTLDSDVLVRYTENSGVDWIDGEDAEIEWDLTALNSAGSEITINYGLYLSEFSDFNRTIYFLIELYDSVGIMPHDNSEGVLIEILDGDTGLPLTEYELLPNETKYFDAHLKLDEMLKSDSFSVTLVLSNTPS